jgi:lipopolysaccharide/colanic/teichoic acid biosynthesis glycosyltransferase
MKTYYLRALRPLIHICVIAGAFWWAYHLRQYTDLIPAVQVRIPPFIISELLIFAGLSLVMYVIVWLRYKIFQLQWLVLWYYARFAKTIVTWAVIITGLAYFGNGFLFQWGISRFVIVMAVMITFLVVMIVDPIYERVMSWMGRSYRIAVITVPWYDTTEAINLIRATITAQVSIYPYQHIPEQLDRYDTVILLWPLVLDQLQVLADRVTIAGKEFFHVHSAMFLDDLLFEQQQLWPLLGLQYKSSTIDERALVVKRMVDLIGSTVGIVLLSPLMAYVAYRIKREDGGPVFFVQERVWLGGRMFRFFKFRSMKLEHCTWPWYGWVAADQYYETLIQSDLNTRPWSMPKIQHDPRVTRVWQRIRAKSLDELPQLFNVWLWSMSLIGPRPHLPREVAEYKSWQRRLFAVKPGITWYAQIFGRDTLDFIEEAKLDLYYIQHWSLWMDVYVMFATLGVVSKWR